MDFLFRHRSSAVLFLVWPVAAWSLGPRHPAAAELLVGVLLAWMGAALRLAALRRLGRGARVHNAGMRGGLAASGPYAYSRNPLYVAAGIVLVGLGLIAGGGVASLLLVPATIAVYTPAVLAEERALAQADPSAFRSYASHVPRWIGLPRVSSSPEGSITAWSDIFEREFRLIPGLTAAMFGIFAIRADVLPIASWLREITPSTSAAAVVGAGLLIAALANSTSIERKWYRRRSEGRCLVEPS